MKTLVYIESKNGAALRGSLECLSAAALLGEVCALATEENAAREAAACGAAVTLLRAAGEEAILSALERVSADRELVLFADSALARDLSPRLAAKRGGGAVTDAVAMELRDRLPVFTRPLYGGSLQEELCAAADFLTVTLRSGSFPRPAPGAGSVTDAGELETEPVQKLLESLIELTEEVDLEEAPIIVAGGRGCGDARGFALVEELAALLHATVGASRPAIEAGWISRAHQIGQSGKNVSPRLYIACGISGALQHVSGIGGAKCIMAINKDPDAPIFELADVGIVGSVQTVLPLLIDGLKKHREE